MMVKWKSSLITAELLYTFSFILTTRRITGGEGGGKAAWLTEGNSFCQIRKKGTSKSRIRSNVWRQCVYKVTGNLSYDVNVKVALPILFPTLFIVRWLTDLFFSGSHISFYCYYQPIIRELQKRSIGLHIVDGRMTAEIVQVRRTEKRERDWSICDIRKASTFSSFRLFFLPLSRVCFLEELYGRRCRTVAAFPSTFTLQFLTHSFCKPVALFCFGVFAWSEVLDGGRMREDIDFLMYM